MTSVGVVGSAAGKEGYLVETRVEVGGSSSVMDGSEGPGEDGEGGRRGSSHWRCYLQSADLGALVC